MLFYYHKNRKFIRLEEDVIIGKLHSHNVEYEICIESLSAGGCSFKFKDLSSPSYKEGVITFSFKNELYCCDFEKVRDNAVKFKFKNSKDQLKLHKAITEEYFKDSPSYLDDL